ncbi:low-density lipoprotein receptor-related protein 4 isoform X2 [Zootermopsis nevadensis]|uniref:low-density lipoprotein receptor-related protein 4 isoform X2 n=1 Tax=Zootermopsis nevadensis TaxID=136037 RepID=UPI000B8EABB1|nr:low-density lipoprotein receptor-related protein 4 isoform X2 [Zootermopsis nevadensis]
MGGVPMYGGSPMYPNGASAMYGSGAIASINRYHGAVPKMYGGVPMYGNAPVPSTMYGYIPRIMYPPGNPYGAANIPILYGNGRVITPTYGHDRSVPTMYGNRRGPPRVYESDWPAPSYRNGATILSGGNMYNNGQLRRVGGASDAYGSKSVLDDDIGEGVPPPVHSGVPDSMSEADGDDDHCGGKFVCKVGEFSCLGSCTCILASWRCDGDADCVAGEDEAECGEDLEGQPDGECNVNDGNVRCPRNGKCIRDDWLCDGEDDCGDFSDETHCSYDMNCTSEEFQCDNGLCVKSTWRCDGDNDCKDFSDEYNCTKKTSCTQNEFQCTDGSCISLTWKCDLEQDCMDGSDEVNCSVEPPSCSEGEFRCAYPRCIHLEFRCDGDDDCGDRSDEDDCPKVDGNCGTGEFKCNNGKCIPDWWRCDDEKDCESGDDEEGCVEKHLRACGQDEFSCSTGNCILKTWVCDGIPDCSRGEDESKCGVICEDSQFKCGNISSNDSTSTSSRSTITCIGKKHVCDGKKDCSKGEDERNCPHKKECESGSMCHQQCVTLADGNDACTCYTGYTINSDGFSCQDIDECQYETDPVCSQTCNNTVGSFTCGCMTGYVLRPDGRTCKALGAAPTLLFANRVDIRQISLNSAKYTALLKGLHNAIALDYHYKKGLIYWSDVSMDVIRRATLNGTGAVDVIRWGLESPSGVAIDWIHDTIFWTDSGTRRVEVATLDGSIRVVIAASDLDKPRDIVAHPGEAVVFWTDWGPNPKIEQAEMDGSNRKAVIASSLIWPNGLCIDYIMSRIYWADAKHHVIESSKFDGTDRKKVIGKGLPHPFALTIFEDAIYWTDWHTKSISTANKVTGKGFKTIHSGLNFPMYIHSYHPQRQPDYPNRCGNNNGGCSHMCLPNKSSYRCMCPIGLQLHADRRNCDSAAAKLLLFARKKDLRMRQLENSDVDMVIPVDGIRSVIALAWDSDSDSIFWTDVESDTINRAHLNGSQQEVIVSSNLESPAGLAVDWVTSKLYWTDAGTNRIEVSNLDGSMRGLLVWEGLDKPRDIVLDPIGGFMYWSDWGTVPMIERAGMDGSQRAPLIIHNLTWPNGLAIDHDHERLYWADGGTKAIEFASLDGTGRTVLIGSELPHPFGLAVFRDKIYWTDWDTSSIHMADKQTGKNKTILRSGISNLMDIRVFHRGRQPVPTMCQAKNGGCSHLCLLAPLPKGHTCACPIGIKLLEDGRTCALGPTNSLIFAHRVDIRQISLDVPYIVDVVLPLPPLKNAIAVDVDRKTGEIYWTDTAEDVIQKATPDGRHIENIIVDGLETADGIVIDSTGRKIYWTDAGRNSIEVAELDGRNRKVLVWSDLESPRAIALHYHLGLMYWSDWGKNPRIEQADMDGENRMTLISENLGWPNGLAIDRPAGRLYWNDGQRKTIESSNLSGQDRHIVVTDVPHPYGLVIVGTHIYWTDWQTKALHRADKINGIDNTIIRGKLEGLMDIRSVQVDNVAENACGRNNGGCSHLCLRTPSAYTCACPTGTILREDGQTCNSSPSTYLLFATRSTLARVSLDTPELWDVTLPIPDVHNAIAVDFHWKSQKIYYTDVFLDIIRSVDMHNLTSTKTIISTNLTTPDGLAVDWIANNIYWTDAGSKVLEVARLDGSSRKIIIQDGLDEPRALAIFPRKGYLYWTDWGDNPKIERSFLDGSSRNTVIDTDLGFPNGLALDYATCQLYWADALRDRIEISDLHGKNRLHLVPEATHPFGLTQYGEHIYWTDWYRKSVERADKATGKDRRVIRTDLDGVMEIRAVAAGRQTGWTPCADRNGGCSHLCLFRQKSYICACPDKPDEKPCSTEPSIVVPNKRIPGPDDLDGDADLCEDGVQPVITITPPNNRDNYGDAYAKTPDEGKSTSEISSHVFITMIVLCLVIVAVIIIIIVVYICHAHQKKYLYTTGRSVLTFSNPNYNASSSDVGPNATQADKRIFPWKRLKYDKSQERVYNVHEDKQTTSPEVVSLIPTVVTPNNCADATTPERIATPPPTPPQRLDSISLKAG